jgi:hypothetical protein
MKMTLKRDLKKYATAAPRSSHLSNGTNGSHLESHDTTYHFTVRSSFFAAEQDLKGLYFVLLDWKFFSLSRGEFFF